MSLAQTQSARIESIDILRGLALALMLLVNNPGSWSAVYGPFLHADWHGITPTDLVFPFFLFVVGASMACSLRTQTAASGLPFMSVFERSFLLFAIGFVLQLVPFNQAPDAWRIMGVLQRIGLSFLFVALLIGFVKERWLLLAGLIILAAYWVLLLSVGDAPYTLENNLVRHVDMAVLGSSHMWQGKGLPFDPEGLLSTIGACATLLSGYLVCIYVLQQRTIKQQLFYLVVTGTVLVSFGAMWSLHYPINKALWTGSFVLVSSGAACLCLAFIVLCWESLGIRLGLNALKIYGSNPIFIYVAAWLFAVLLATVNITAGEQSTSLKGWLYSELQSLMPDKLASLVFALLFTALFYFVALFMYKKRIFIKL